MTENDIRSGAVPQTYGPEVRTFASVAPYPWDIGFDIEMLIGYRMACASEAEFFGPRGRAGWGLDRYKEIKAECEEKKIKPFKIPTKNQGQQSSCTGQGVAQYLSVINAIETGVWVEISPRDIYSHISLGEGRGAYLIDAILRAIQPGVATEELVPTYHSFQTDHGLVRNPMTEREVLVRPEVTDAIKTARKMLKAKDHRTSNVPPEEMMNKMAWMMLEGLGCFYGLIGENNGTWMSPEPTPPEKYGWGHALYAGKCGMRNGKRYVSHINSWGDSCGETGWQRLYDDYFLTRVSEQPAVFNPWTLVDAKNMDESNVKVLKDANGSAVGIWLPCTSPEALKSLMLNFGRGEITMPTTQEEWDALIEGEFSLK